LVERLQADETTKSTRPPLTELSPAEEIRQLLNDREPLYRDSADFCVSTDDRAPEEITRAVLDWLQARLRPGKTVD
jgi:shikimate kinase